MPTDDMSERRREGMQRRELDDIHEKMCQLGYLDGRLLGPTEADEAEMAESEDSFAVAPLP
jgi:hypothetical protein